MLTINSRSTTKVPGVLLLVCLVLFVARVTAAIHAAVTPAVCLEWKDSSSACVDGKLEERPFIYFFTDSTSLATRFPSELMEKGAFTNREIISYVSEHFIPVKLDLKDSSRQDSNEIKADLLAKQFSVGAAPTLVVALPSGVLVEKQSGYRTDRSTLAFLKEAYRNLPRQRAMECMKQGQFKEAVRYAGEWLSMSGLSREDRLYGLLYQYTSLGMTSPQDAHDLLVAASMKLSYTDWPRPCLDYLLGKTKSEKLFQEAGKDKGKNTEAHYVIGFEALTRSEPKQALEHFEWIRKNGAKSYIEYDLANIHLGNLAKNKDASVKR